MRTEVISIRIKRDVKRALLRNKINISKRVNECLEVFVEEEMKKDAFEKLREIVEKRVKPSPKGFAVRSVREDRDEAH